jgi:hypothetical protein
MEQIEWADRSNATVPTAELATLEPPPPELVKLLEAVHGNPEAMDGFARVIGGVASPAEFFSDKNVERIYALTV